MLRVPPSWSSCSRQAAAQRDGRDSGVLQPITFQECGAATRSYSSKVARPKKDLIPKLEAQSILDTRSRLRLGQVMLQSGRWEEGRQCLQQVLERADADCKVSAACSLARSYLHGEDYENALRFCDIVEEVFDRNRGVGLHFKELKHARFIRGLALLRGYGDIERAAAALNAARAAAAAIGPRPSRPDELLLSQSCFVEALRGNFDMAEELLRPVGGHQQGLEAMVASAFAFQCQGDLCTAEKLLRRALQRCDTHALALLRLGHVLLSREPPQLSTAIESLQYCLMLPCTSSLTFGRHEQGAAHVYLCVAYNAIAEEQSARNHFMHAWNLLPELRRFIVQWEALSKPKDKSAVRVGLLAITCMQASLLAQYAARCGLLPTVASCVEASMSIEEPPFCKNEKMASVDHEISSSKQALLTLVGTSSTAVPSSEASEPASPEFSGYNGEIDFSESPGLSRLDRLSSASGIPEDKIIPYEALQLQECLSQGELTTVHRATLRGMQVVVKTVKDSFALPVGVDAKEDVLSEIAMLETLSHPRLVTFLGSVLNPPSRLSLVTAYAKGGSLHYALYVQKVSYSNQSRFQLTMDLLEGVEYLHSSNVVHLDIKPSNLVLDADSLRLQICDLGMAQQLKAEGDDGCSFGRQAAGGTPRYMAPECHDSTLCAITALTDIWSVGCVLIEIFDSSQPYPECKNAQQIVQMLLIKSCPPRIPQRIEARVRGLIAQCLHFESQERWPARQLLLHFRLWQSSATGPASFVCSP